MDSLPIRPYRRRKQILELLAHHEPLSVRGLTSMLSPPIHPRRLRDSLSRLYKLGLITKRNHTVFGGAATFYQCARTQNALEKIKRIMGHDESLFDRNHPRVAELLHWEECAVLAHRLKAFLPEAQVIREHEFKYFPEINEWLLIRGDDLSAAKPDLVILLKSNIVLHSNFIAVEIERSLKSKERLRQKLEQYANRSIVDGVIYVCSNDEIINAIELMYHSKRIKNSLRIGHYGKFFLMFMDREAIFKNKTPILFNSDFKSVELSQWLQLFKEVSLPERRNSKANFQPPAAEGCTNVIETPKTEIKNKIHLLDEWD